MLRGCLRLLGMSKKNDQDRDEASQVEQEVGCCGCCIPEQKEPRPSAAEAPAPEKFMAWG
jgi:hypothetical protein